MSAHVGDRVGSISRREPVRAEPTETLRQVAEKLWTDEIGVVVVCDPHGRPSGLISERDIVAALAQGADPDEVTADKAMTPYVVSLRADDQLFDAAGQMLDRGIRHLPVLDESGSVVGMVSVRDLLRPLLLDALGGGPEV